jgi:RsiG-like
MSSMHDPGDHTTLTVTELDALMLALEAEEADLSARRVRLHNRIDFARQTAASDRIGQQRLDKLIADERVLAAQRRDVHARIDRLKAARRLVA